MPRLKGLSIELTSRKVNSLEQPPTHVGTELYSQQGVPRRFWLLSSRNAIKKCLQDNNSILVFKFLSYFVKISTFLVWIVINKKAAFKIWIDSYTLTKELFNFYKEYLNQESQFNRSNIIVYLQETINCTRDCTLSKCLEVEKTQIINSQSQFSVNFKHKKVIMLRVRVAAHTS